MTNKTSKYVSVRLGKGRITNLIEKKSLFVLLLLMIFTVLASLISIGIGDNNMFIAPLDVLKAIFGMGDTVHVLVVQSFRLPRIIISLLIGAALAVSGAIFQGVIRNPLASPDYSGVLGGASVGAVGFLVLFTDSINNAVTVSTHWLPLAAFIGASMIAVLVYLLSWKRGVTPVRLVLVGIGLTMGTNALTTMLMISGPLIIATQSKIWLAGSVYGTNWESVAVLVPWVLCLIPITMLLARKLNLLEFGEDIATGSGSKVHRDRLLLLFISAALAAGAVSFGGAISFVGLLAPHIARRWIGNDYNLLLPVSALAGALIVLLADLIGRTAFLPLDVPVGIFTALVGAPYFIYLLYRYRHS